MDLKNGGLFVELVEDNDSISRVSAPEADGNLDESTNNGSCEVEDFGNEELFHEMKSNGTKIEDSGIVPPETIHEISPSPQMTRKGFGLKKWRRIKRDVDKSGGSSEGSAKIRVQNLLSPEVNSSKRLQFSTEEKQKSEGSVSSINAVERGMGGFTLLGNSGLAMEPLFAAGTDSENSEDHSSKSSTAASAPKILYEAPGFMGFSTDKGSFWGSPGKKIKDTVQGDLSAKSRVETSKKFRGDLVEIEKENCHSSLESSSQSSFIHTNNGIQSERPATDDGPNGDEVQGSSRQLNDGIQNGSCRDCEGISQDVVADTSWKAKDGGSENLDSSTDQDPLIFALQSVQEALEKEVIKFREIIKDASIDDSAQDSPIEFEDGSQTLHESKSVQCSLQSELENLFKQKMEAEIEYLAMSRMVQHLRIVAVDQISTLESLASAKIKLEDADYDDKVFQKNNKKMESFDEDITGSYESSYHRTRVYKYTSYFFLQLVLLTVILGVILRQLSRNYIEVVPT